MSLIWWFKLFLLLWLAVWLLLRLWFPLLHLCCDTFLFSIGVYGDVMRVKILFNKKENALIQMSDGTQAQLGSYTQALQKHHLPLIYNFLSSCHVETYKGDMDNVLHCEISYKSVLFRVVWLILWTLLSYEPPEWPASSWQRHACGIFKTHHSAAAQRRPWGPGPHKGLQQLTAASFQETRLQKLLQHLPTLCNTPPLQHTVSAAARALFSFSLSP